MFSTRSTLYLATLGLLLLTALGVAISDQESVFYIFNTEVGHLLPPEVWVGLTILGDTLVALAIFVPFLLRHPKLSASTFLTIILASLWVHVFKDAFGFPRPAAVLPLDTFHVLGPIYKTGSFPSGHATTAFALATLMAQTAPQTWVKLLIFFLGFFVALARVMVGAHWPLDILAGAAGGIGAACFGIAFGQHLKSRFFEQIFPLLLAPTVLALLFYPTPYDAGRFTLSIAVLLILLSIRPFMTLASAAREQWGLFRKAP
jgi:membrane-associated phospholipid phosphatase